MSAIGSASLVTPEIARPWQEEHARIKAELDETKAKIGPLQARLAQLDSLLKAAAAFSPDVQDWLDAEEEKAMGADGVALTDVIKKMLGAQPGKAIARDTIKAALPTFGFSPQRLQANPNYFYTALKRLVVRTEIEEAPPGHFRLKQS